jgi:hypothetical protein
MASRDGIHVFAHFVVVASIWFNGATPRSHGPDMGATVENDGPKL